MSVRHERMEVANRVILSISVIGRRFFYFEGTGQTARFEICWQGRLWFRDEYTNCRVSLHPRSRPKNFSNGGTLWGLVKAMQNFIDHGTPVPSNLFGPWPDWYCRGDLWGYGNEAMENVRATARQVTHPLPEYTANHREVAA